MEDALERLKVLDYETRYCQAKRRQPLDRTYFALPAKNPSVQLQNFLDIVAWLILEITGDENLFKVWPSSRVGMMLYSSAPCIMSMLTLAMPTHFFDCVLTDR